MNLKPYDVLQVDRGNGWVDFATLRNEEDFANARHILQSGWVEFDGSRIPGYRFRVRRGDVVLGVAVP